MLKPLAVDRRLLKKTALVYRAINHDLRHKMLQLMHQKERISVTDLYTTLRLEQSVASQHLGVLRKAELVRAEREGKHVYYAVSYERLLLLHQAAALVDGMARAEL